MYTRDTEGLRTQLKLTRTLIIVEVHCVARGTSSDHYYTILFYTEE